MSRNLLLILAALLLASVHARAAAKLDQARFVKLGGIEQWISIKGDDPANPVLLVVHGGPGDAQWPQADKYVPWEKYFTVVQWDQRGAGHTFGRYGKATPNVNLAQIAEDGEELAQYLCKRLDKRKIIVLGHSWGSDVAVTMVKARPDLFAAYVGTGQVTSWAATVQSQFDLLLAKARADKNEAGVKKLEAIGRPDPNDTHQYFSLLNDMNFRATWPESDRAWISHLIAQAKSLKGDKDFEDLENGMIFSGEHLIHDEVATNLFKTATRIETAFFVIQGAEDVVTPTKIVVEYFNRVQAPRKKLVLIPDAGHFAFMTKGRAFLDALVDKVRPVAIARGA